jgi:hypothetical protein
MVKLLRSFAMGQEGSVAMNTALSEGGCLCGAVRYRAEGQARDATLCHCRTCRKAAGSPVVAWVTFPANGFTFVSGKPAEYRSSAKVIRTFCGSCGTPLTYRHTAFPSAVDVTTCSLDDPESFAPADHTFLSHRLRWVHINESLPARTDRT